MFAMIVRSGASCSAMTDRRTRVRVRLALAMIAVAAPAMAQTTPAPVSTSLAAPDPARIAAAERLLTVLMPPGRFQAMIDGVTQGMQRNVVQSFRNNPAMASLFDGDPRARPIFERYMTRLSESATAAMKAGQPEMMAAMARAYARRFTVAQMAEVEAFFRTPTGQVYMEQGTTIMADPDVAAWQQKVTAEQFARMPEAIAQLTAELAALPPRTPGK